MLACMENVGGFAHPVDKQTGEPPLASFLQLCNEMGVTRIYNIKIYLVCGSFHLVMVRQRVYLVFTHKLAGGKAAANRAARALQDASMILISNRAGFLLATAQV